MKYYRPELKLLLENLANLIKTKTILTFTGIYILVYGFKRGMIEPTFAENIILMVFTYYLGTQAQKTQQKIDEADKLIEEEKESVG